LQHFQKRGDLSLARATVITFRYVENDIDSA